MKMLSEFDDMMVKKPNEVIILVDNAPSHIVDIKLNKVIVHHFPPNLTAHIQPPLLLIFIENKNNKKCYNILVKVKFIFY